MNCKDGTLSMTTQICNLLKLLNNKRYAESLELLNGSSLGQHFRHILDFYSSILKGNQNGYIDYSDRERNVKIEIDATYARGAFESVLDAVNELDEDRIIPVRADFSNISDDGRPTVQSSIGRELMFAYDHALHHLAIIKIGIRNTMPEIQLDETLGVAPATVKFRKGNSASN